MRLRACSPAFRQAEAENPYCSTFVAHAIGSQSCRARGLRNPGCKTQALPEAAARHECRLEAVACKRLLGPHRALGVNRGEPFPYPECRRRNSKVL